MPRIPLIEDLTSGSLPIGSNLTVEYDSASQWYNASLTMTAGCLDSGGKVWYTCLAQPPGYIRSQLKRLGVNTEELEKNERFRITDWYTATLGQKSQERHATDSLKIADLSILVGKWLKELPGPDWLRFSDDISVLARFNDEKFWVEFVLARLNPYSRLWGSTAVRGIIKGVHSEAVYRQLEAAADGIIDFKLEETEDGKTRDLMRIRSMRNMDFERGWHQLKTGKNFEVTLLK